MNANQLVSDIEEIKGLLKGLSQRPAPPTAEQLVAVAKSSLQIDTTKVADKIKQNLPDYVGLEKTLLARIDAMNQPMVAIKPVVLYRSLGILFVLFIFLSGFGVYSCQKSVNLSASATTYQDSLAIYKRTINRTISLVGTKVKSREGFIEKAKQYYTEECENLKASRAKEKE